MTWLRAAVGFVALLPGLGAQAPPAGDPTSYAELVKKVGGGDLSVDFRALRFACLKAPACDARGDSKDLMAMRRALQDGRHEEAVAAAGRLMAAGYINIEAHMLAARSYASMKNEQKAAFHREIATRLIESIMKSGDGKTKETAFEVVGTWEEYIMLRVLGFTGMPQQALLPGKLHSYDVLQIDDPKTGTKASVFFNIDAFFPPKL